MLGNRYGFRPLIHEIPTEEFEMLAAIADELSLENREMLSTWYRLDENNVPPKYILQVSSLTSSLTFFDFFFLLFPFLLFLFVLLLLLLFIFYFNCFYFFYSFLLVLLRFYFSSFPLLFCISACFFLFLFLFLFFVFVCFFLFFFFDSLSPTIILNFIYFCEKSIPHYNGA